MSTFNKFKKNNNHLIKIYGQVHDIGCGTREESPKIPLKRSISKIEWDMGEGICLHRSGSTTYLGGDGCTTPR